MTPLLPRRRTSIRRLSRSLLLPAVALSAGALTPAVAPAQVSSSGVVPGDEGVVSTSSTSAVNPYAPNTLVHYTRSQQVMVAVHTGRSAGYFFRYQWRGAVLGWKLVGSSKAYFGHGGTVPAARRLQNTGTTPLGTFRIPFTFGTSNPATKMQYRTINRCSWWIQNPANPDYNRWRQDCRALSKTKNEYLPDYAASRQYRQAAVIGFNYDNPIRYGRGSGAGIFLHYDTRATAGCVGIDNYVQLTATIRWLNPVQRPMMVIKAI